MHPCIMDIKIGKRTWYEGADPAYVERCRRKDASTTQGSLGFKICGMQVYRHGKGGYWRASKRWCKTLPPPRVGQVLASFTHNENGIRAVDIYGGKSGVLYQLSMLEEWFRVQTEFKFFSSSLLILYEGGATCSENANVQVRFVDFAHTFKENTKENTTNDILDIDDNFLDGLLALKAHMLKACEDAF